MIGQYYFLSASLPELKVGSPLEIHFPELIELYWQNLTEKDFEKTKKIRLLVDLSNLKELLREGPFDPRGNFNRKELEDAILNQKNLPEYVFDFLEEYDTAEEQIAHFSKLIVTYFSTEMENERGFFKEYLEFERKLRLLLSAHRAKRQHRDLSRELMYEDQSDPFVSYLIASKDASGVEMPMEFARLAEVLSKGEQSPSDQYQELTRFRMEKVNEMAVDDPFSIDWLLAYMVLLILMENWYELDEGRGKQMLNKIVKETA